MRVKVFLSWSGERSKQIAAELHNWLPNVIQQVDTYFSPETGKGAHWFSVIAKELEESHVGILCLTPENTGSTWMMFESGALVRDVGQDRVCPVLFGLSPNDLQGPLAQFQTTVFRSDDMRRLLDVVNNQLDKEALSPKRLDSIFGRYWPELEERVGAILAKTLDVARPARADRELLEEILTLARTSARRESRLFRVVRNPSSVFEAVRTPVMIFDAHGRTAYANSFASRAFQVTHADLMKADFQSAAQRGVSFVPDDTLRTRALDEFMNSWSRFQDGETVPLVAPPMLVDFRAVGVRGPAQVVAYPIYEDNIRRGLLVMIVVDNEAAIAREVLPVFERLWGG